MNGKPWFPIISCEHGGNQVPTPYQHLFVGQQSILASHRSYDAGALLLAEMFAATLSAPLFVSRTTRLLVDLNRSVGHRNLFGPTLKHENKEVKQEVLAHYYHPYREQVKSLVADKVTEGMRVLHLSIHSFSPVFDGTLRKGDIGLLYDPAHLQERRLSRRWKSELQIHMPRLRVRFNWPYRGIADGFAQALRRTFDHDQYLGIEVEVNQGLLVAGDRFPTHLSENLVTSIAYLVNAQAGHT